MSIKTIIRTLWLISALTWLFLTIFGSITGMWIALGFMWLFWFAQLFASDKKIEFERKEKLEKLEKNRYLK